MDALSDTPHTRRAAQLVELWLFSSLHSPKPITYRAAASSRFARIQFLRHWRSFINRFGMLIDYYKVNCTFSDDTYIPRMGNYGGQTETAKCRAS
jgi:hypothetical protein